MLSWSFILQRVKEELSLPFQLLEKSDPQIVDYLKRNALRKFEQYFPQKWRMTLNCALPEIKVSGRTSEFYLIDPDERDIRTVTGFVPTMGPSLFNGHPFMGPWTTGGVGEWALQTYNYGLLQPFSNFNYTTEFIPPNMLRVSPIFSGVCVVEYERTHDPELSSINPELEDIFVDLCLGMFMMNVGRLRQKYNTTSTPFGEIPLNGDGLYNDGKEIFDRTIDLMKTGSIPNVSFEHG
jgi:hypothetical protein